MANLKGTNVSSPVVPFTDLDKYPTHYSKYGRGGHKEIDTYQNLLAIPATRLTIGTVCYVKELDTEYRCTGFKLPGDKNSFTDESSTTSAHVGVWIQLASDIVVSDYEPAGSERKLWLDTGDIGNIDVTDSEVLNSVNESIIQLKNQMARVMRLLDYGIISGDSTISWKSSMFDPNNMVDPNTNKSSTVTEPDGSITLSPNTYTPFSWTVPNFSIKKDTAENFRKNYRNLIDGELIWITDVGSLYIYIDGVFKRAATDTSGGSNINPDNSNMTTEELRSAINDGAINFDALGFVDLRGDKYKVRVNETGNLIVYNAAEQEMTRAQFSGLDDNYISPNLTINSVFCGGSNNESSYTSCSHNFVELSNSSTSDINLNGIYLMYRPKGESTWQWIPLCGTIKSGSTYLVRGARCSVDTNTTIINVDSYDLEWYQGNKVNGEIGSTKLLSFSQTGATFYLVCGKKNTNGAIQIFDNSGALVNISDFLVETPYQTNILKGYIDSVGIQSGSAGEGGAPVTIGAGQSMNDCLFFRWFTMDPVSQANKSYDSRNSSSLWTYINLQRLDRSGEDILQSYFSESDKLKYTPRSSREGKTIFNTKSTFDPKKPNYVNITFGKQATYGGSGKTATRCFNWVSVGYYNEYVEYRLVGSSNWIKRHSITDNSIASGGEYETDDNVKKFIKQYSRIRWISTNGTAVTTHKLILRGLTAGDYEYRVGREGDASYVSDILRFSVKSDSDVTSLSFVQVTDQQGFNWMEYEAWKKSASFISTNESNLAFTINTGDVTQNGNRENEWLDYYSGREALRNIGLTEMFTIGNNDLCGKETRQLGDGTAKTYKINHLNVTYYYTFELDSNNPAIFKYNVISTNGATQVFNSGNLTENIDSPILEGAIDGNYYGFNYYMPSLYSFDYGPYHFVCLNSEFTDTTYSVYSSFSVSTEGSKFKASNLTQLEKWFRLDLLLWKRGTLNKTVEEILADSTLQPRDCSKAFVYTHEIPFTIVTKSNYESTTSPRAGSKLNDKDADGNSFVFSRLFKSYGIKLVFGGHKHTYSVSLPIYDAPSNYITLSNAINTNVNFLSSQVSSIDSCQPVVQVLSSNWDTKYEGSKEHVRYEKVSDITAPTYVMSQATGYKLVSNKELPSSTEISWLNKYFPAKSVISGTSTKDVENIAQHYPTYIRYDVTGTEINVTSYQIHGIWEVDLSTDKTTYIWNRSDMSGVALSKSLIKVNGTQQNFLTINI